MRFLCLLIVLMPTLAIAHPPPELAYEPASRPIVEWSTWFRLGYGVAHLPSDVVARSTDPAAPTVAIEQQRTIDAALGFELSLPLTARGNLRFGPWFEFRGFSEHPVAGGQLVLTAVPAKLDMFFYEGKGILALRAGGNDREMTGSVAWGYLAPWNLFGSQTGASRYMIGVRFVATVSRDLDDPRVWSATGGLEVEPFGALRYLLGIRSWYR
ncbi:MAG: hypothetical protein NT062_29270 [Proteobacteria bacterium]|nr:hypothetical protein [Pseudomonadota bacterium]